jgi:integrase
MSTTRSATLRVAHTRSCPNANKTALDSAGVRSGCTCTPSYYTSHRDGTGKAIKGPRVRDRRTADRALRKLLVQIDEGRTDLSRPKSATFAEWADKYLEILEENGRRNSTVRAYEPTVGYANAVFGSVALRQIGNDELRRFVQKIRANKSGDATCSKHLRHLSAILSAAIAETPKLLDANPVPGFKKNLRLRVPGGVEAYTDLELARLWASMKRLDVPEVYVAMSKLMTCTGLRVGECVALSHEDVDLLDGRLEVRHHYDRDSGALTLPKDGEARAVHLIGPARQILEGWIASQGVQDGAAPLFPAPRARGRVNGQYLARVVDDALGKATPPVPRIGENGRKRKPLHSLRASFARLMLEQGRSPMWVESELGHSSLDLTVLTYGQWSEEAKLAEAAKVEAPGFPV